MNEPIGIDPGKRARPRDAGGSYIAEVIIRSRIERRGRGGRLPLSIWGTGGLTITGNVSFIDDLEGLLFAGNVRLGPGVDGISHPDTRDHDERLAGSSHGLRGDRLHGRNIKLFRDCQSSRLHSQVKRFVIRMPESDR